MLVLRATAGTAENAATLANVAAASYVFLKQQQAQASIVGAVETLDQTLVELPSRTRRGARRAGPAPESARCGHRGCADRSTGADRSQESRISGQLTLIDAQIAATANSIAELDWPANWHSAARRDHLGGQSSDIELQCTPSLATSPWSSSSV